MTRWRGSRKRAETVWDCTGVRLVRLDTDSTETALLREALLGHDLPPEQLRFTGLPAQTLPDADTDPKRFPYAIVAREEPLPDLGTARDACAGFGVLDGAVRTGLVDSPEHAVLMRAYYVTPQWQGRGIGQTSCSTPLLDRLAAAVAPHADKIVLCVNQANQPAQRVYKAAGFEFAGHIVPGNAGPQEVMSRPLDTGNHPAPHTRHRRTEN